MAGTRNVKMAGTRNVKMEYDVDTFAEIKQDASMSQMAQLSEILRRNNKKEVEYNLDHTNVTSYGRMFVVKASNGDLIALGRGLSENSAKKNAAKVLLDKIYDQVNKNASSNLNRWASTKQHNGEIVFDNNGFNSIDSTSETHYSLSQKVRKNPEEEKMKLSNNNYVGLLQEFCIAHHFPLPKYTFSQKIDEKNKFLFKATCLVSNIVNFGLGQTKHLAKRNAAHKIFMQIKSFSVEEIERHSIKYNHKLSTVPFVSKNTFSCNIQKSSKLLEHLSAFMKKLEENEENKYDAVDFLDSIGNNEGFSAKYINVINGAENNKVIVQLTTTPVTVCVGTGKTADEAQISAAVTMLSYLELVEKQ